VYGIVTQCSGYIWVYSEPDHGSTIKIYLPRIKGAIDEKVKFDTEQEKFAGTETVLLVEDDERVRKMVYLVLRSQGYQVLQTPNGNMALRVCEEYDQPIHLLLTDVVMPEVSGMELAREIQKKRKDVKVLYMSGYTDNSIIHHQNLVPGINFLEKPFSAKTLSNKVREMLDQN